MIRRVIFEDWQGAITVAAFCLIAAAFLFLSWRALRLKKDACDRAARLPLDKDSNPPAAS
jgi:hypothetical protein